MEIRVDGAPTDGGVTSPGDAMQALLALNDTLRAQGRAIVEIALNGTPISLHEVETRFSDGVDATIDSVDIRTDDMRDLVRVALEELEQSLPELPTACHQLAAVFQGDRPAEGFEPFQRLAGIWEHIKARELQIASALDVELGEKSLHGKTLETHHQELNNYLLEAEQAVRGQDTVVLGDLLEYELAPRAGLEAEIVALLKEQATGRFA